LAALLEVIDQPVPDALGAFASEGLPTRPMLLDDGDIYGWRAPTLARWAVDSIRAVSDNLIMAEISATDASRRFADMLDAVEHRGETYTVVRRGRAIATITPAHRTNLADLRQFLRAHPPDEEWERDLADVRRFVGSAPMKDAWND
jgi:prevent-host-death family protein